MYHMKFSFQQYHNSYDCILVEEGFETHHWNVEILFVHVYLFIQYCRQYNIICFYDQLFYLFFL